MLCEELIVVRGGGDIATGTIHRLWRSGFRVLVLELPNPSAIRRRVAVSEAMFQGSTEVEGMRAVRIECPAELDAVLLRNEVPVLQDPAGESISRLRPSVLVDAILAKRNCGTTRGMAPLTIALGPGFTAGVDADFVIETQRGHDLGRIITEGSAAQNTGVPGLIAGQGALRVIHAPESGCIHNRCEIGDIVREGELLATIGETEVRASLSGVLRGIIRDGYPVEQGLKIADIDPRISEQKNCSTISDKSRCIAGSVLELLCRHRHQQLK